MSENLAKNYHKLILAKKGSFETKSIVKKLLPTLLLIVILLCGYYFGKQKEPIFGNTPGNLKNGGAIAIQDEWIYYYIADNIKDRNNKASSLYKVRADGSGKTKLLDQYCSCINVVGDWIFYLDKDYQSFKIRTNGTGNTKIENTEVGTIVGDWTYFIKWIVPENKDPIDGEGYLFKSRIDGSEKKKLCEDVILNFNIGNGWVYYQNQSDSYKLYKIRFDGTQRTKLTDDEIYEMNLDGTWIYYTCVYPNGKLFRIKTNGTNRMQLNDETGWQDSDFSPNRKKFPNGLWIRIGGVVDFLYHKTYLDHLLDSGPLLNNHLQRTYFIEDFCSEINVSNGWIYYCNDSQNSSLYKIRCDGTQRTKLADDRPNSIHVIRNWVYYWVWNEDEQVYDFFKIRTDGSGRQMVDNSNFP